VSRKIRIALALLAVLATGGGWLTSRWLSGLERRVEARFSGKLFRVP